MLRINVWISYHGFKKGAYLGVSFPYVALCPSTGKKAEFRNISDVYDEIIKLSDEAERKGYKLGEAIYTQSFFFANHALLINIQMQNRIKEFRFCKSFSCPPYSNLQETPVNIVDDFAIIEEEFNYCIKSDQKEKDNAKLAT